MRPAFIALLLVSIAVAVPLMATADSSAAAQTDGNASANATDCSVQIDHLTRLCGAQLVENTAVIEFESDRRQSVVITDVGPMMDGGGQMPQHNVIIEEGRSTVEVPVSTPDGYAGVTIATNEALYGKVIEENDPALIGGPWTHRDVQLAALLALLVGVSSVPLVGRIVESQLKEDRVL